MKKFVVIMLIVVLVIVLGIIIGVIDSKVEPQNEDVLGQIENLLEDEQENGDINEELVNGENNNIVNEVSSSETFEEEPKTEEEKAINIVKVDWNNETNSKNIKFTVDGMDESGRYIVSVRDKDTTEALAFYIVNVNDETFTKREMN